MQIKINNMEVCKKKRAVQKSQMKMILDSPFFAFSKIRIYTFYPGKVVFLSQGK